MKISEIGLGSWLTYDESNKQNAAEACIHKAYELGVNFSDAANVYNYSESEKVVEKAFKA